MQNEAKNKKKLYEERRPFVAKILEERPACEACKVFAAHDEKSTFIQHPSQDVHELVRRSQGALFWMKTMFWQYAENAIHG